jgi:hypothetical protein
VAVIVAVPDDVLVYVTLQWALAGPGPLLRAHVVEEKEPVEELVVNDTVPVGFTPVTVTLQVTFWPTAAVGCPHEIEVVVAAGEIVTEALPELGLLNESPPYAAVTVTVPAVVSVYWTVQVPLARRHV